MNKLSDSDPLYIIQRGYHEPTRCLMFLSTPIPPVLLGQALGLVGQYNDFNPKLVTKVLTETFGEWCNYKVGRESSVVIYLIPHSTRYNLRVDDLVEIKKLALIDEVSIINGELRMWWD